MRRFSGAGGKLYTLGERFCFSDLPLQSSDGWDWNAPVEFSYWLEKPEIVMVEHGERSTIDPAEFSLETGWVGLPRNMSHGYVLATGSCLPISCLGHSREWSLNVDAVTSDTRSLGEDHMHSATKITGISASLKKFKGDVPISKVLVRLPLGAGEFVGIGEAHTVGMLLPTVEVSFKKEGISYAVC